MTLAAFTESQHIVFAMVPPLEIRRSMLGIVRGKRADVVDSKQRVPNMLPRLGQDRRVTSAVKRYYKTAFSSHVKR